MNNIPKFVQLIMQAKTKLMEPRTVDIGKEYLNALLKKLIYIDMAEIAKQADIVNIRKVLISYLEKVGNCSAS
jgi:hypothetical protein